MGEHPTIHPLTMSSSVTQQELHQPANDPAALNVAPGVDLSPSQRRHVAVIIDLFQGKGSMSKVRDNFAPQGVYEDEFAKAGGIDQIAGQLVNVAWSPRRRGQTTIKSP